MNYLNDNKQDITLNAQEHILLKNGKKSSACQIIPIINATLLIFITDALYFLYNI